MNFSVPYNKLLLFAYLLSKDYLGHAVKYLFS